GSFAARSRPIARPRRPPPVAAVRRTRRPSGDTLNAPALHRTFDALHVPNYRRYFAGQVVSTSGNWIQNVAAMWLMVELTGDGLAVGLVAALQFVPLLLFGQWGGVLADRVDKRRLLLVTQVLMIVPAALLAVTTFAGVVTPVIVYVAVLLRGAVLALDNPARQALPIELVGPDRVVNAVALNSVVIHSSRIIGPAIAGLLIAVVGIAWCFVLDGLTFVAMLVAVHSLDRSQMHSPPPVERRPGAIREGIAYVRASTELMVPLAMMAVVGLLAFNFTVVLPLMAHDTWGGGADTYTLLTIAMAVGSVTGGLVAGTRATVTPRLLVVSATAFGVLQIAAAIAPLIAVQVAALVALGVATVTFSSGVQSTLQLRVAPEMRGRVMALYSLVFLGSTPFGAPLIGWIAGTAGPRVGMAVGGLGALLAAGGASVAYRRIAAAAVPRTVIAPSPDPPLPTASPVPARRRLADTGTIPAVAGR
ncbi:MAG: MFS transporter, partial [Solirubrobacteraceae bacterium]